MERFSFKPKLLFIILLVISSLTITGFSLYTIHLRAIQSLELTLTDIVHRQAAIVNVLYDQGRPGNEIISFFREMRKTYYNLGKTGEVVMAWRTADSIKFLIASKPLETYSLSFSDAPHELPMKLALMGKSGFIKSNDYLRDKVFASYMYIPETQWGMVAKISVKEINAPYTRTAIMAFIISVILISLVGFVYTRITNPLINRIIESEERLKGIFNNAAIGIVEIDNKYRLTNVNNRMCQILGYSRDELTGKTISQITMAEDRAKSDDLNEKLHSGEIDLFSYEKRYLKQDGTPLWAHVTVSAVRDAGGQHVKSIGTVEDISERKEMENAIIRKNEELTRFIYTVSHDLKSPLVTIKSFTSYLKEDIENQDKEAQEKDFAYIRNAADNMGRLLDELLELSRIGRKEEPKTEVQLQTILENAIELVAGRIKEKKVNIRITGPSVMLTGYPQRLLQLYQNLLDNAVKFMDNQPEPLVEIGSFVNKEKNGEVVLFVRDNGSGIDPRYHHKIFGLFEKLHNNNEGSGIGLALVKRIVEVHEGSIWFTSEGTGKGTTFYFTIENTRVIN